MGFERPVIRPLIAPDIDEMSTGRSFPGRGTWSTYGEPVNPFDVALIESVARVLGDTDKGLTNTEIGRLLAQLAIDVPLAAAEAQAKPGYYVRLSKRDRISGALIDHSERPAPATD